MFSFLKLFFTMILSLIVTLNATINAGRVYDIPEVKSQDELTTLTDVFKQHPVSDEIVVVNTANLSVEELYALVSLQGLVSKKEASIFINKNASGTTKTANELDDYGYATSFNDAEGNPWNYKSVMEKFATSEYITDKGYVLYSTYEDVNQLNTATNMATVFGWLPVPEELEDVAISLGLTKCEDISDKACGYPYQLKFYNEHKDVFVKNCLVHQNYVTHGLRDLAIQQNIFVMYTLEDQPLGKAFRDIVLDDLNDGSLVLGWGQYEIKFVESLTAAGHCSIPSDHCDNNSLLSSLEIDSVSYNDPVEDIELDPSKHYVVLLYSDGDNAQWVQNGYNEFYQWQKLGIDVPITWSFPPLMNEFSTIDANRVISSADDDCFVCGPSGAGYTRMSKMYGDGLAAFSDLTAAAMLENCITTVTLLDSIFENTRGEKAYINKIGYYARYDNIKGGLLQLDGERYAAGHGRVFFVNDKPFVSVRLSLWYPDGEGSFVPKEWIEEQADVINSYPADINSISGYSVINIHPWSFNIENLAYFVSLLDEDVEVITGDELICAVDKYVPHENAMA